MLLAFEWVGLTEKMVMALFLAGSIINAIFILWQIFSKSDALEDTMGIILFILAFYETIVLILTRFVAVSDDCLWFLGVFYIEQFVILILQFYYLGIKGGHAWNAFKSIIWMGFYVILFLTDIMHIDILKAFISDADSFLAKVDDFLKNTWIGDLIKGIILAFAKIWFEYKVRKHDTRG